jgi:hypothetical protein
VVLNDVLRMELTVQTASDEEYAGAARLWLRSGLESVLEELHAELAADVELSATATENEADPWGPPNGLWAGMSIRGSARAGRVRPYSNQAWKKFRADIARSPAYAGIEIRRLDHRGRPGRGAGSIRVQRLRDDPGWCGLELTVTNDLVPWQSSQELQNRWVSALRDQAEAVRCTFGYIADDGAQGRTGLELALNLSAAKTIPLSRGVLRGYSWTTVCGAELAKRLGGAESLRRGEAFFEVAEFPSGGLLLRATESYADYDEERIGRVFQALAPVLPQGTAEPVYGYEHLKLVYGVDAADRR